MNSFTLLMFITLLGAFATFSVQGQSLGQNGCFSATNPSGLSCPAGSQCFSNGQIFAGGPNGATCCPTGTVGCGRPGGLNIICINPNTQSCCVPSGTAQVVPIGCNLFTETCNPVAGAGIAQCIPNNPQPNSCAFTVDITSNSFDPVAFRTTICWRINPLATNVATCFFRGFGPLTNLQCFTGPQGAGQAIVSASIPSGCQLVAENSQAGIFGLICPPNTIPNNNPNIGNTVCITFTGRVNLTTQNVQGTSSITLANNQFQFLQFTTPIALPTCPRPL